MCVVLAFFNESGNRIGYVSKASFSIFASLAIVDKIPLRESNTAIGRIVAHQNPPDTLLRLGSCGPQIDLSQSGLFQKGVCQ